MSVGRVTLWLLALIVMVLGVQALFYHSIGGLAWSLRRVACWLSKRIRPETGQVWYDRLSERELRVVELDDGGDVVLEMSYEDGSSFRWSETRERWRKNGYRRFYRAER